MDIPSLKISSVETEGAIELKKANDPHFKDLEFTRSKTEENDDPNWLRNGIVLCGVVVFAAVPILWLGAIVALHHFDRSTQEGGAANAADSSIQSIGLFYPTPVEKKKKKSVISG